MSKYNLTRCSCGFIKSSYSKYKFAPLNRDTGNSPTRIEIDYIMMNYVMKNIDNIFAH